jgi:hypothetical protein
MFRNTIFVLLYHRHKLLVIICSNLPTPLTNPMEQNLFWEADSRSYNILPDFYSTSHSITEFIWIRHMAPILSHVNTAKVLILSFSLRATYINGTFYLCPGFPSGFSFQISQAILLKGKVIL